MSTMEVIKTMSEIKDLVDNIDTFVPQGAPKNNYFRSDLSGLLVVSLAATYENCVKDIIIEHAGASVRSTYVPSVTLEL